VADFVAETGVGKLFKNGRSQAVRLPREFRFDGDQVRLRRVGRKGLLIEPLLNPQAWFAELDALGGDAFLATGRDQPPTPERQVFD
jgi:antitoxin VapB